MTNTCADVLTRWGIPLALDDLLVLKESVLLNTSAAKAESLGCIHSIKEDTDFSQHLL